jgi:hypothetical protein
LSSDVAPTAPIARHVKHPLDVRTAEFDSNEVIPSQSSQ